MDKKYMVGTAVTLWLELESRFVCCEKNNQMSYSFTEPMAIPLMMYLEKKV